MQWFKTRLLLKLSTSKLHSILTVNAVFKAVGNPISFTKMIAKTLTLKKKLLLCKC